MKPPVGVSIISALFLVACLFAAYSCITIFAVGALYLLALYVFFFLLMATISYGLSQGHNWGRIIAIIYLSIGTLVYGYAFLRELRFGFNIFSFLYFAIDVLTLCYLIFSAKVKAFFLRSKGDLPV